MGSPRSSFAQGVGTTRQSPAPEVPEVAEWHTLLDVDFAALPNQTLSPDGPYLIGAYTWTKHNSAQDQVATAIINGTGLVLCPLAGLYNYQNTRTASKIALPLSDLFADVSLLRSGTPLRAYVRGYNANGPLGQSELGIGLEYSPTSVSLVTGTRFFTNAVGTAGQCLLKHDTSTETVMGNTPIYGDADCSCIWMPLGIGGMSVRFGRAEWSSGWPDIPFLAGWSPSNERWEITEWPDVGFASNWEMALYAQTQGQSADYQWVIQNARVDAFY